MSGRLGILASSVALAATVMTGCSSTPKPGLAHGRQLYDTCRPCHGTRGEGDASVQAPAIAGLPQWYVVEQLRKYKGGLRGAHPADTEGHRMRPMARTLKTEDDVASVAQYVSSFPGRKLPATVRGGDPVAGQVRYNAVCLACHGADGRGNELLKAPNLVGQADWYTLVQLEKFKSGLRGAHPEDISGSQMRAMAMTLEDGQAMRDVVAYIQTLSR